MPSINLARERSLYTAFADNAVQARQMEMARLQEQLSSGSRLQRPSDDPSAFTEARQMELLFNRYSQYMRSIGSSQTWVDHTQEGLDKLSDLFTEAYERGIRVNNATFSAGDREAEATKLEAILENMVDVLNTRAGDEYVFAGSRTTVKPFVQGAGVVNFNGNNGSRERHIGRDLTMNINIDGERLHDTGLGYTVTEAIQNLIDAIRSGVPADIDTAIGEVAASRDDVIDLGGEAGSMANRLELADQQLRDASSMVESRRSELEDLDFAEAMSKFQQTQVGLQAAVRVASAVINTTLLDYLR
ncbi:MAG: flagellar hook-associated protein FlgL [Rhodothermales bacterium]